MMSPSFFKSSKPSSCRHLHLDLHPWSPMELISPIKLSLHCRFTIVEHLYSALLELFHLSTLIPVLSSIEGYMILQKCNLIFHLFSVLCFVSIFVFKSYFVQPSSVYLVDFSCLRPPNFCRAPLSTFLENASMIGFDRESVNFMAKILNSSGLGEETYLPPTLHEIPPNTDQHECIKEVQMALFPIVDDLLSKTKVSPQDIDILVVNCSGFCPSPSLSSIVVNRFSMRADIKSYSLSGMGCSAGAIAIDLAHNLLKIHKNSYALILSTEILSTGWYPGHDKSKLFINCLFRMGAAAVLLSNKKQAKKSAKYKLSLSVRTQRAVDDRAYYTAFREEDSNGKVGVTVSRDMVHGLGETARSNVIALASQIFPPLEKLRHGLSILRKRFIDNSSEVYVPNFKSVIQHFCLPTSGMPLIKEIGKELKLGEEDQEPALMTFHRFGNQSSSSLWYELAYMEAKERVKEGDRVWLFGVGSGGKSCSLVWECLRPVVGEHKKGPWADCIHHYPTTAAYQSPSLNKF